MTRLSRFSSWGASRSLRRLAGAMFAFALMVESGCLLPQSIDAIPDAGAAPHIVVEKLPDYMLFPTTVQYYFQGPADLAESANCHCELDLTVNEVEEADPVVPLEARWFLDYDPSNNKTHIPLVGAIPIGGAFNGSTTRPVPALKFDPGNDGKITDGPHVLDVVIAARDGFDPSESAPLPGRSVLPGFQSTAYRINVQVTLSPNQALQQCVTAGASVRVGCAKK